MPDRTRILLIDDDAVDRASVRRALKNSGIAHELAEASDGAMGLSLARSQRYDCVLLDYRIPGSDAFEILAELQSPEGGAQAVVMLTGESDQEIAFRLMRAGALDYLAKSEATPSSLARAIRYAKARRGFLTELETARIDAEEKSKALDILNRQKTLLLSVIAHDLRNPFQVLLGLSTMLSNAVGAKDPAMVERRAQGLHEAAEQAHTLMESLFSWASLQMDAVAVELDAIGLDDMARQILAGAAEAAAAKDLRINAECGGLWARAHRDMLAAVLRNLLSNAIKFTLAGGEITISACKSGDAVDIEVVDTGVGMTPETLVDLFAFDRRTTTIGTAGERGSGFGLILSRELAERQGGTLTVRSTIGAGTTFRLTLQAADPPA